MTDVLAQKDAYLQEFEATVTAVNREEGVETPPSLSFALDRTAFFPGGGGQPYDLGWLNDIPVVRVSRRGEWIWHWLTGYGLPALAARQVETTVTGLSAHTARQVETTVTSLPEEGATVKGRIDWQRRYRLMRTHTAFHILCGVVWRDYQAQVTGGNMEELRGRMDFEFETLRGELVHEIEEKINAEVAAARPVQVRFLPREEAFKIPDLIRTKINLLPPKIQEIRIVEIQGLDLQADGGTHVANTREVGAIRISGYKSKGRINKRIELILDS
ncbi:MAG: alanyl-tRNA editing protein [Spirochaetaceae bacterium]|nr:MAG: alanyl-tRNA editing protein [Spirochaetaceae bacterium]